MMPISNLALQFATATQMPPYRCAEMIELVFKLIHRSICAGEIVAIGGFGSFAYETVPDRVDHHPSTGAEVIVSSCGLVTFRGSAPEISARVPT